MRCFRRHGAVRSPRRHGDRGSISAFVAVVTLAVMMCAGLVIDGARGVANHTRAADHAENAARAGAQQLIGLREGAPRLDPRAARTAALKYLGDHGVVGAVQTTASTVTVTVIAEISTVMLQLVGVPTMRATATRSAAPVSE